MTDLITLRLKTKTGSITEIQAAEILEIDGKPYTPEGDVQRVHELCIHLDGRLQAVERILAGASERAE